MCGQTVSELIVRVTVHHAHQYTNFPRNKRIAFVRPALLLKVFYRGYVDEYRDEMKKSVILNVKIRVRLVQTCWFNRRIGCCFLGVDDDGGG